MHDEAIRALEAELTDLMRRQRARARAVAREVHPRLEPANFPLLVVLGRDGAQRLSTLREVLGLDTSTVSRQIDAVERMGLVRRVPDPADARARLVELTEEGRTRLEHQRREHLRRLHEALATWPEDEIRVLTRMLRRLGDGVLD